MRLRHIYLVLCVIGALLPYSQLVPWCWQHGLDLSLFFHQLFANRIGAFFALDVIVSALVLWVFIFFEGTRIGLRHLWLPVVASIIVGVSLGLPLFLYLRQRHLDATVLH
jgi:predicted exporter